MFSLKETLDQALIPVMVVIVCGYLWRRLQPAGLDPFSTRRVLGSLVMYITYPALALSVVSSAQLNIEMLWVPALTVLSIVVGVLSGRIAARLSGIDSSADIGAVLLACGFGNLISLGIPVVAAVYGDSATRYAIYADIMGLAPLLWTLGFWVAMKHGQGDGLPPATEFLLRLAKLPPLWAFLLALLLNFSGVGLPGGVAKAASMVGNATMPCMLLTVGMSLSFKSVYDFPRAILVVGLFKLVLVPLLVLGTGLWILGDGEMVRAVTILAAMPTMMATIILSEEFGLNTELLATLMVGNTLLFFLTLPLWISGLSLLGS